MGIGSALNISLTGLKANQTDLDVTANNIANAGTAGYSRKRVVTQTMLSGPQVLGVRVERVERELDIQVQRQWRVSSSAAEYASTRAGVLTRLDQLYGGPSDPNALDTVFNNFKSAFETLANSPDNNAARLAAAASGETLAARIRGLSADIQTLRQDAESAIGSAVTEANELLKRVAGLDDQIVQLGAGGGTTAHLEDERDRAIDQLSKLMDIRVEDQQYGAVAIYTTGGTLLFDDHPVEMAFDEAGTLSANAQYSVINEERTVGTIRIVGGPGVGLDLFRDGSIRSGAIAAYKELRDETLVQAQAQLDELAAKLATAITNRQVAGTTFDDPPTGLQVDLAGLKPGNSVTLTAKVGGVDRTVTFIAHDGSVVVDDEDTADPNDSVFGIDLSGASGSPADQIAAALGGDFTVGSSGDVVQISNGGSSTVTGLTASITPASLQSGDPAFALFVDGANSEPYYGLLGSTDQKRGFSSRLQLNASIKADPANLVKMAADTQPADPTRPRAVLDALTQTQFSYSPAVGIGSDSAPFTGTLQQFVKQVISTQGAQAQAAQQIDEGQRVVTSNLEERYTDSRKVNLDEELARLIELQTAYQANARVMTAAREMLDTLMNM